MLMVFTAKKNVIKVMSFFSEPEHRDQLLQQVEHTGLRQQMIRWLWRFDPAMARHQEVIAQKPGWYLDNRPVDLHGHYQRSPEDVLNEIKMIKQEGVSDASAAILNTRLSNLLCFVILSNVFNGLNFIFLIAIGCFDDHNIT